VDLEVEEMQVHLLSEQFKILVEVVGRLHQARQDIKVVLELLLLDI
jgi:hypothetical protein